MANEITFAEIEGELGYDYLLMFEDIVSSRYPFDNVRQFAKTRDIGSEPTDSARFTKMPVLAASSVSDGTDITANTAFQPTTATAAVGEVGLKLTLTDLGRSGSVLNDPTVAAEAGKAVLKKVTTDLCALGSGFSNTIGSSGSDLTEANVQAAMVTLIGNNSPDGLFGVLHTQQALDLVNDIGTTIVSGSGLGGGTDARSQVNDLMGGFMGGMLRNLYGIEWVINPEVPTANAGADRAGFIGVRDRTIGLVWKWYIRPEFERDASLRGTETVVTAAYAVLEIEDETGIGVITDA